MSRKVLETKEKHYSYGVADNYNIKIRRVSRWIKVDCLYVTEKHSLWDYADKYDLEEDQKAPVNCFRYNGRLYALEQFMRLPYPMFYMEDGEEGFLSGYDCTDYYYPLLIEISDCGEAIRLYQELKESEYKAIQDTKEAV